MKESVAIRRIPCHSQLLNLDSNMEQIYSQYTGINRYNVYTVNVIELFSAGYQILT